MTAEQLVAEGRELARPTVLLRPTGSGPVAAIWYEPDPSEIQTTGHRCWISVDTHHIPDLPSEITGFMSLSTDEDSLEGGRIEVTASMPARAGTALYAETVAVLPPIDVVFALGNSAVGLWLRENSWPRNQRYNDRFPDKAAVEEYQQLWLQESPMHRQQNIYAVLGGWHWSSNDEDWIDLINEQLMVLTIRDAVPWVEGWRLRSGSFRVIQRGR